MSLNKFRTKELTWDKAGKQIYGSIEANSGDSNGRKLVVQVLDGGVIADLTGAQLNLSWKTNTNTHKGLDAFKAVDLSKGIFEIAYTTEMLSNVGRLQASLVLIDKVGRVESNLFTITVSRSNVDDESVQSEDSFTALTEALVTVNKYDIRISGVENSKADKTEVEESLTEVTSQLAQKPNERDVFLKERGINVNDFDEPTRQTFLEAQDIDVNYVLGKGNVKSENIEDESVNVSKTNFIKVNNLYDKASFISGVLMSSSLEYRVREDFPNAIVAVIPIIPNREYIIKPLETIGLSNTRYAVFSGFPEHLTTPIMVIRNNTIGTTEVTFTSPDGGNFLALYLSADGVKIPTVVQEGSVVRYPIKAYLDSKKVELEDDSVEGSKLKNKSVTIENTNFIERVNENLYNHTRFIKGALTSSGAYRDETSYPNNVVVYIPIEPNQTYTIKPAEHSQWDRSRYAVFKELPKPDDIADLVVNGDDTVKTEVTFTNGAVGKFLLIALSNSTSEILPCQVEVGTTVGDYEEYGVIVDGFKFGVNKKETLEDDKVYFSVEDIPLGYLPLPQPDMSSLSGQPLVDTTHDFIYNFYDDLVENYPEYVSKRLMGYDNFENAIYQYTFKPTAYESDMEIKYPKILLTTAVHGNEKTFPYAVAKFFTELCERWREVPQLDWLRHNVEFIIMPVAVPTGYDDNTRPNRSGVNVNRNFEMYWSGGEAMGSNNNGGSEPFSEPETQYIKQMIDENLDAEFYIDCHNMGQRETNVFLWFLTFIEDEEYKKFANKFSSMLSRRWSKRYDWVPESNIAYTSTLKGAGTNTYGIQNGIKSYTLEIDYSIKGSGGRYFNSLNLTLAMEDFGNYIIALLKEMKGKESPSYIES